VLVLLGFCLIDCNMSKAIVDSGHFLGKLACQLAAVEVCSALSCIVLGIWVLTRSNLQQV
jgi:hypothetical protein